MQTLRFASLCAAAVLALGVGQAAQADTTFALYGNDGYEWSNVFVKDGITLTVTATSQDHQGDDHDAKTHQDYIGMGVKHLSNDGSNDIDSDGWVDTLWLEFSETVTIDWAMFSHAGDHLALGFYVGKDKAHFSNGDGDDLGYVELSSYSFLGLDTVDFSDENLTLTGQIFGITAGDCEAFRLKKIGVSTVPTAVPSPSAAGAGLGLLGLLGLARRRRNRAA